MINHPATHLLPQRLDRIINTTFFPIRPIPVLRREGYYMIINGYKDLFLDSSVMRSSDGDRFLPGTSFEGYRN